jgi:lipoprotein NlpD
VALGGCSPGTRPDAGEPVGRYHVVRPGETVFGIAARYGLDYRDLARWNGLGDGSLIRPGQRLRLEGGSAPAPVLAAEPADAAPPVTAWRWPLAGELLAGFGASARTASGILIGGRLGEAVRAAAGGEVVYAGSGLAGYGQLVIIRHNAAWLSAYGHNRELLVAEGARVAPGAEIARLGEGPGGRPALHFEIRRNGAPVDPLAYLPRQP